MDVTFIATRIGLDFRGEVIDMKTQKCIGRTGLYASAETAKSAAASLWRAQSQMGEQFAQAVMA